MSRTARRRRAPSSDPVAPVTGEPVLDGGAWWMMTADPLVTSTGPADAPRRSAGPTADRTLIALPAGPPPASAFDDEVQAVRDEGARLILRAAGRAVLSEAAQAGSSQNWSELLAFRLSEWHKLADQLHQLCRWEPLPPTIIAGEPPLPPPTIIAGEPPMP